MDQSRQSFLGKNSPQIIASLRVAIVGLGGGGSHIAQQLAHVGIGNFVLVDFDHVEDSNLNRLVGATAKDVNKARLKVDIIARQIKAVNPAMKITKITKPWQEDAEHLRDCHAIFGCVDSFSCRRDLEVFARRYLIPYIDIGMDVHPLPSGEFSISGQTVMSLPGELCLKCLGFLTDDLLALEAQNYRAAGGKPQVVWPNGVLASMAVGLFMQLYTPWHYSERPTLYLEYDGNESEVKLTPRWPYLEGKRCPHFNQIEDVGDPFFEHKE